MFEFTPAVRTVDEIRAEIAVVREALALFPAGSAESKRLASLLIQLSASERVTGRGGGHGVASASNSSAASLTDTSSS